MNSRFGEAAPRHWVDRGTAALGRQQSSCDVGRQNVSLETCTAGFTAAM